MELISLKYAIFVIVLLVLYYCFPKKYRWYVLLAGSMAYYVIICKWYVLFIIFTICTTYGSTIWIDKLLKKQNAIVKSHKEDWDRQTRKEYKEKGRKKRVAVMLFALLCNFGILAFLKYIPYAGELGLLLPLGISFYTFQSMGYVMDVYREIVEPEKNFLKVALFVSFFPQIIQGPIAIYDKLAGQLYEGHSLRLENLQKGALLVLWGVMKKLVIADRAVNIINFVMDKPMDFSGTYVFFAEVVYALQLYADFSGGIDIVRGIAEMFGITMSTNFNHPYFSRSLTEYWHRWHMTLGDWCRNYIFYPLSISKRFLNFGKWLKPRFGAHISKVLPGCIIDAEVSRYVGGGLDAAKEMAAQGRLGKNIVIALGTNGPIAGYEKYEVQTRALLEYLGPDRHIFWVNVYCPELSWQQTNNDYLVSMAKDHPNVTIVDWYGLVSKHPEWLGGDGIHPNDEGTAAYAKLIHDTMAETLAHPATD